MCIKRVKQSIKSRLTKFLGEDPPKTPIVDPGEADLNLGKRLLNEFIVGVILLLSIFILLHVIKPEGFFTKKEIALEAVRQLVENIKQWKASDITDTEAAQVIPYVDSLNNLAGQLGTGSDYTDALEEINQEITAKTVRRTILFPLLDKVKYSIQANANSLIWHGSIDRWIDMAFAALIGTLMFLIKEIKRFCSLPFGEGTKDRNFTKYLPWYRANLIRGPFVTLVILLALTNLSVEIVGISIDVKTAPAEAMVVLAAILGYFSREADKQMELIAAGIMKEAWKKAHPDEKKILSIVPPVRLIDMNVGKNKDIYVTPTIPVTWQVLKGVGTITSDGKYTAPDDLTNGNEAILLAVPDDEEYNTPRLKINIKPNTTP